MALNIGLNGDIMIALTGGKTGGHVIPLLALAKKLSKVIYVGAANSLEERLCLKEKIEFIKMDLPDNSFKTIYKCYRKLELPKIEAVISTGGYISMPLLIYAIRHHIPIYLLEENVVMGRANLLASFFAKRVFLTYELPKMKKKYEVVGLPTLEREKKYYGYLDFDVLIIGGSLGSKPLCNLVYELNTKYKVCLIAGRYSRDYQNILNVTVFDYVDDIISLMKQAKVIISRAGASTTYEIFSLEKPCIIIPSMKTKQNHQYLNALYFEKENCAVLVKEKDAKKVISAKVDEVIMSDTVAVNLKQNQKRIFKNNASEAIIKILKDDLNEL